MNDESKNVSVRIERRTDNLHHCDSCVLGEPAPFVSVPSLIDHLSAHVAQQHYVAPDYLNASMYPLAIDRGKEDAPQPAKHGWFSDRFFRAMSAAMKISPSVVEHVVSLGTSAGSPEDKVDGTREAPLPMSVQAFLDANEVYSLLVYWARVFADSLHIDAPGPAVKSWRNRAGTIIGLPANPTPGGARYSVTIMSGWLTRNLEDICDDKLSIDPDDVKLFHDGLKYIFQADARWPRAPKPFYSDMPCPSDLCTGNIAVYPPTGFGEDEKIVCEGCGRHFLPEDYERLIGVFKQIRQEQAAAQKRTAHLTKKYVA